MLFNADEFNPTVPNRMGKKCAALANKIATVYQQKLQIE